MYLHSMYLCFKYITKINKDIFVFKIQILGRYVENKDF